MEQIIAWDLSWFHWINAWAGHVKWLDKSFVLLTKRGPLLLMCWLALGTWLTYYRIRFKAVIKVLAAIGIASVLALTLNDCIGYFVYRDRPFVEMTVTQLVKHVPNNSFPSNHAAGSIAMATVAYLYRLRGYQPALLLALGIGFSRIYVGVHHPLDVMAGVVTGLLAGWLVYAVSQHRIEKLSGKQ